MTSVTIAHATPTALRRDRNILVRIVRAPRCRRRVTRRVGTLREDVRCLHALGIHWRLRVSWCVSVFLTAAICRMWPSAVRGVARCYGFFIFFQSDAPLRRFTPGTKMRARHPESLDCCSTAPAMRGVCGGGRGRVVDLDLIIEAMMQKTVKQLFPFCMATSGTVQHLKGRVHKQPTECMSTYGLSSPFWLFI